MARIILVTVCLLLFAGNVLADERKSISFGLTAVVVKENLRFFDEMSAYLGKKTGHNVTFIQRKTYREIMDLLDNGSLDFAWICGYPFVQENNQKNISLLAVPIYKGKPFYRSYIIVNASSKINNISELKNKVFAYSDPDSNSGFLYPRYYLKQKNEDPDNYFRQTFFTYSHTETVEAVAAQFANGGAVDSYIWEFIARTNPEITNKTKIIHSSPLFGFPPIVAHKNVPDDTKMKMTISLTDMNENEQGIRLLNMLHLDGIGQYSEDIYNDIKVMNKQINERAAISFEDKAKEMAGM